tara:strand:+ start:617 stop:1573 length:957 start_codon:yes stop_codon:yes gene_type:complete
MKNIDLNFPLDAFEDLIIDIGWNSLDDWFDFCCKDDDLSFQVSQLSSFKFKDDWIWGLILPLLSDAYQLNKNNLERSIIGLSALPGTGKTTLGLLVEKLSLKLDFKICVISLDDFYLPASEMKNAVFNNPWNVSRGFPGTHSVNLIEKKLLDWKNTGILNVPVYDKSLRSGLGDRSRWKTETPDLVILEGWFLGINPYSESNKTINTIDSCLSEKEINFRKKIQTNLVSYIRIWNLLDKIWHIKPENFEYMKDWKCKQEEEMFKIKGSSLRDQKLVDFLRMLIYCIPHKSFDLINSNVLLVINKNRKLIRVSLNNKVI